MSNRMHLQAVLASLLLWSAGAGAASTSQIMQAGTRHDASRKLAQHMNFYEGELELLLMHSRTGGAPVSHSLLHTQPNNTLYFLRLLPHFLTSAPTSSGSSTRPLTSGARIRVTGTPTKQTATSAGPPEIVVSSLVLLDDDQPVDSSNGTAAAGQVVAQAPAVGTAPSQMQVLVVILSACNGNYPAAVSKKAVEAALFDGPASLSAFFSSCSHGATEFSRATSRVVGPVPVGCSGTDGGWGWSLGSCEYSDNMGVAEAADEYLRSSGVDVAQYKYRSYILPTNTPCAWSGLGHLGCSPSSGCRTWFAPSSALTPAAYAHELGHNLFLHHASKDDDEYGDSSCSMGYCCGRRCYNHPHMWQLGWAKPLADLNSASLAPGTTRTWPLPAAHLGPKNMLRIRADWDPSRPTFFVGLRSGRGGLAYDAAGADFAGFADKVSVWQYNGVQRTDVQQTHHLAALDASTPPWRRSGLVLGVSRIAGGYATVSLCRKAGDSEANCGDRLDDDCDGLVDAADPDCPNHRAGPPPAAGGGGGPGRRINAPPKNKKKKRSPPRSPKLKAKHKTPPKSSKPKRKPPLNFTQHKKASPRKLVKRKPRSPPKPRPPSPRTRRVTYKWRLVG